MRPATLKDLLLEAWLRAREQKAICWTTKEGKVIPINEITDTHLVNTINMLYRHMEEQEAREAERDEIMDHIGEMDPLEYYD